MDGIASSTGQKLGRVSPAPPGELYDTGAQISNMEPGGFRVSISLLAAASVYPRTPSTLDTSIREFLVQNFLSRI